MVDVQVAIVGCGPAGLLLSHLLERCGIATTILERRSRAYVEGRIRAGVLEPGTVALLQEAGVGARMAKEGLVHEGLHISADGVRRRVDLAALTGGRSVTVYGQTEITRDMIAQRLAAGRPIVFEAENVALHEIESDRPRVSYSVAGEPHSVTCDFVAGCDGFHGVSRRSLPHAGARTYERDYPFAWLGVLVEAAPPADELIYVRSPRGFALCSMRSPQVSRLYVQCAPNDRVEQWPDDRVWEELRLRLGRDDAGLINEGPVVEKSVTPMRSFVCETMRHGRLYLAGDAAHIVPPTGAKGLNLAASDVHYLAEGLDAFYSGRGTGLLAAYPGRALARVWKAQRFSWWMTALLHRFPDGGDAFEARVREAELDYVLSSPAALASLAENYVGLPL